VAGFIGSPPMNALRGTLVEQGGALWFRERNPTTPLLAGLTEQQRAKLSGFVGREVVLGLRPEHILDGAQSGAAPYGSEITATVEIVEPMGAETFLHFSTGAHSFIVRAAAEARPQVNQMLALLFDMSRAHFFDAKTEQAIG
jgi:multiple sugar transport system ATP-binding protein